MWISFWKHTPISFFFFFSLFFLDCFVKEQKQEASAKVKPRLSLQQITSVAHSEMQKPFINSTCGALKHLMVCLASTLALLKPNPIIADDIQLRREHRSAEEALGSCSRAAFKTRFPFFLFPFPPFKKHISCSDTLGPGVASIIGTCRWEGKQGIVGHHISPSALCLQRCLCIQHQQEELILTVYFLLFRPFTTKPKLFSSHATLKVT